VDTESGTFDFETASGSFAGFRVDEELVQIGSGEAVGRTGEVAGTIVIDGSTLGSADIEVDMTDLQTDQSRRDNKVQDALETDQFPTASFSLTQPVDLGPGGAEGEEVSVQAVGDLTIHGVTQEVTVDLDTQLVDGTAVVVGSVPVTFSDYGVEVPSAPMVLSVADEGTVELQLLFVR
jgi:polyisoprenoid-binding protein YceI